jgi:hypothetical protein
MKQRPILFSTQMVKAILEGRKTQTRRTKGLDYINSLGTRITLGQCLLGETMLHTPPDPPGYNAYFGNDIEDEWYQPIQCPYARQAGDVLWVREEHYRYGHWVEKEGVFTRTGRQKWMFVPLADEVLYEAPESFRKGMYNKDPHTPAWHKRIARFMPKSACRILLRITDIRVERLQDITEMDAFAEGIDEEGDSYIEAEQAQLAGVRVCAGSPAQHSFANLWMSINGPDSWPANPWVWVVSFEKTEKPSNI